MIWTERDFPFGNPADPYKMKYKLLDRLIIMQEGFQKFNIWRWEAILETQEGKYVVCCSFLFSRFSFEEGSLYIEVLRLKVTFKVVASNRMTP